MEVGVHRPLPPPQFSMLTVQHSAKYSCHEGDETEDAYKRNGMS